MRKIALLAAAVALIFGTMAVVAGPVTTATDQAPISSYDAPAITNAI